MRWQYPDFLLQLSSLQRRQIPRARRARLFDPQDFVQYVLRGLSDSKVTPQDGVAHVFSMSPCSHQPQTSEPRELPNCSNPLVPPRGIEPLLPD